MKTRCGKPCSSDENDGEFPCQRSPLHDGDCTPAILAARALDGQWLCCGMCRGTAHSDECPWSAK